MHRIKQLDSSQILLFKEEEEKNFLRATNPIIKDFKGNCCNVNFKFKYVSKHKHLRDKKNQKSYVCELSIYPTNLTKKEAKKKNKLKIISLFIFNSQKTKNGMYRCTHRNDYFFKLIFKVMLLKLKLIGSERFFCESLFDFLFRVFFSNRAGELSNIYKGKDYEWFKLMLLVVAVIIIAIVTGIKEADFYESFGWG